MRNTRTLAIILAITITMAACVKAAGDEYTFILPVPVGTAGSGDAEAEQTAADASTFLDKVCEILSKKTGDVFHCKVIPKASDSMLTPENIEEYIKTIEELNYSAVYISSNDLYRLKLYGYEKLRPAVTITFNNKQYDKICLYMKKDSMAGSITDLEGKTWAGSYFYMPTRYLLYKHGIDMPLGEFFGKLAYEPDDAWVPMATKLVEGEIELFPGTLEEESVGRAKDKRFNDIESGFCVPHRATHLIAFNRELPDEKMNQLRHILLGAHKDTDFRPFWFIFAAIQGHFEPFDPKAFNLTQEYVDICNERGWLDEQLEFTGTHVDEE